MIRVLIVDDSPTVRQVLQAMLTQDPEVQVAGVAVNGRDAIQQTLALRPDIITMDVQMPLMDGIEATRAIMEQVPTPIVMVTSYADDPDTTISFAALRAGALHVVEKPTQSLAASSRFDQDAFVATIKALSEVKVIRRRFSPEQQLRPPMAEAMPRPGAQNAIEVVAIGSSTGGPAALNTLLRGLPPDFPTPIVVVQHIAAGFTTGLVDWLQHECHLQLTIATRYQQAMQGTVYFAPDAHHLVFRQKGLLDLNAGPPVHHVRPSVTVLFESLARHYGGAAAAVLLTGMGEDGAAALKDIHVRGGLTIGQDEATSVVYGMPKVAAELGACSRILPIGEIAAFLVQSVRSRG